MGSSPSLSLPDSSVLWLSLGHWIISPTGLKDMGSLSPTKHDNQSEAGVGPLQKGYRKNWPPGMMWALLRIMRCP